MRRLDVDLSYPRVLLIALVVAAVATGGYAAATSTAAFGSHNPGWDGGAAFRELAAAHAEVTIGRETAAYATVPAANATAVVLAPDQPYGPRDVRRVASFLERGGRLVVAGDFGPPANGLLAALDVDSRLDGRLVRDERFYYRSPALPVATNVSRPLAGSVSQVTLNYGSVVDASANASVRVATSGFAYLDANANGELDDADPLGRYPVVVEERVGNGSVVVVSDPSVFINAMLDRRGNRAFATHLVSQRDHVLLDYSHTADVPVAAVAVLVVRESWPLQVAVAGGVLGLVAAWAAADGVGDRVRAALGGRESGASATVSTSAVVDAVAAEHPEWDEAYLRRVTQSIRAEPDEDGDDD